ncbi:Uncharacterised protein [Streptococcus equi subsp. zooepidemicus]|nr:hypothetical protein [Streptococcus equi]SQF06222.1 Uncharacterised protein [Streptococcus equi subsp. zooepidemicus]HEL0620514.1 hypothetical protein [Streptococcus equi subsp. zooepidemicus]HEL0625715.1 hypothetical protein [Streptococcus equi subsp. zooepidemicus]HEL0735370.1 hypothetical protein [Streptococcus equi subsp. zooepidemicus]HEL1257258.1 hypothetical protein [Streptococcus equi subsp. zooepidemicus]
MISEKDYGEIANDVYKVDSGKESDPYREKDTLASGNFKILKAEDNPGNGMQAMAVALIKGSEVGKSHIMIVYVKSSYLLAS